MQTIGYLAALLIGISLGLVGGGGSILTVPVMVYVFGLSPLLATSYSLFIVGSTSLVGAYNNFRQGLVNMKAVLLFGAASTATVFAIRKFLLPRLPQHTFYIGSLEISVSLLTMIFFAILMVTAAFSMIRNKKIETGEKPGGESLKYGKLIGYGVLIGVVTGLLGAGGGFLLIPALVLLLKLPMKEAIGTSLLIIALNSLVGFMGDLGHFSIDWPFLIKITIIAIIGIFLGGALNRRIKSEKLKKGFGWFVLIMGIYMLMKELVLKK